MGLSDWVAEGAGQGPRILGVLNLNKGGTKMNRIATQAANKKRQIRDRVEGRIGPQSRLDKGKCGCGLNATHRHNTTPCCGGSMCCPTANE